MNNRLLTLDDLYNFYSKYKKSVKFNAYKNDEPVVVQIGGSLKFEEEKESYIAGLTRCRLQACHTETNLNKSTISYEVMEQKLLPSFKNRPILGFIHIVLHLQHTFQKLSVGRGSVHVFMVIMLMKKMATLFMMKLPLGTFQRRIMLLLNMMRKMNVTM